MPGARVGPPNLRNMLNLCPLDPVLFAVTGPTHPMAVILDLGKLRQSHIWHAHDGLGLYFLMFWKIGSCSRSLTF